MSQLSASGAQPQKAAKYASIYTGSYFNGIYTNRSPLRAASAQHSQAKAYGDASIDALIAGSNIEISNRLTLVRRPGNPKYDTHTYNQVDSFDEFRVNKGTSDVFGTTIEEIFTMIDEGGASTQHLYSLTDAAGGFKRGGDSSYEYGLNFIKSAGAGQSYMQAVGNSLYFANGVDNKKWLTSLFVRNSSGNNQYLQGLDGLAGTYPFGTYLVDPDTGNLQQFIGITPATVSNVVIVDNVLTLTVSFTDNTRDYPAGTYFQLYNMTSGADFLNGATIKTTEAYEFASDTTLTASFNHIDVSVAGQTGIIIQAGTTGDGLTALGAADSYVARTGGSVPTWGTTQPSASNDFLGSVTLDGNTVWVNRGVDYSDGNQPSVYNWGIKAPTTAPTYNAAGHALAWQQNTYYSPASVRVDPTNGNLWQVTIAGKSGSSEPTWNASPVAQQKVVITSIYSNGTNIFCTTTTQSPALVAGDQVEFRNMSAFDGIGTANLPNLNGVKVIVSGTGLTTTTFRAPYTAATFGSSSFPIIEYGQVAKVAGTAPATTQSDGGITWTCIQLAASLTWNAHTHYDTGHFLVASSYLFQLGAKTQPWVCTHGDSSTAAVDLKYFTQANGSHQDSDWQGAMFYFFPGDPATYSGKPYSYTWAVSNTPATQALSSLWLQRTLGPGGGDQNTAFGVNPVNGAGEVSAVGAITPTSRWDGSITCLVFIPRAGTYTFSFQHSDGGFFSFDSLAVSSDTVVSGATATGASSKNNVPQNFTSQKGYGRAGGVDLCGTNRSGNTGPGPYAETPNYTTDSVQWTFPQAGAYALEIDFAKWYHSSGYCIFMCPGSNSAPSQTLAMGLDISGTTAPSWPAFTTSGASYDTVNQEINWGAKVVEIQTAGQQYTWNNLGPIADYVWDAGKTYTLPGTTIVDTNSNQEGAYETGVTGTVQPTWISTPNYILADPNPPLKWINEGPIPPITSSGDTITATSPQGWLYWIALVNTLDQTVSNVSPVSLPTGPVVEGQITFAPGAGLNTATIDPQADYVAIFRSADGFPTPLLVPGFVNSPYTVPLSQYLKYGYVDVVPDTELNNLVQGAAAKENTPPASGAINLSYHLQRIWFSIGNTVYWTSGPLSPVGNGTDGAAPGNFAACPSQIRRLVPTAIGMLVFTVSDIYIIAGNGTATNPLLPPIPYFTGIGLGNYNALDINGGLIGFFTTDRQFVIFNPSAGLSYVGIAIGNQFRLNNGQPGQSWVPSDVYVAYHTNGEDVGWYVGDGANGWFKLIPTPAPEQGVTWSPFATVLSTDGSAASVGITALASIETSPGVHNLLSAQDSATGYLLARDLLASTDGGTTVSNGATYKAWAVIGSIVLADSGQVAKVAFITTESVKTGTPLTIGVILDEALPYYTGSFDVLKRWTPDPPNLPPSESFYAQRFYLSELDDEAAYCRHLQILVQWPPEAALNELQTMTIFGAFEVEQ